MPQESMSSTQSSVKVPTALLLSLGTIPVLALLVGGKAVLQVMREVGEASEEIFRGDRLPILETQDAEKISERSSSAL